MDNVILCERKLHHYLFLKLVNFSPREVLQFFSITEIELLEQGINYCLPACLPACLLAFRSACLPFCLPVCLLICHPDCLPSCLCLFACLPACLPIYLPACLTVCLFTCLPVLSVCLHPHVIVWGIQGQPQDQTWDI